jgi:hypothetical protein
MNDGPDETERFDEADCDHVPWVSGRLWVKPSIEIGTYGRMEASVWIVGDPEGLRALGEHLIWLAGVDQTTEVPEGKHYHTHLSPRYNYGFCGDLGAGSCEVELCRADACGTGEIYKDLLAAEEQLTRFRPDSTPAQEWLAQSQAALALARRCHSGAPLERFHVGPLATEAIFCALMAVLRFTDVKVPSRLTPGTEVFDFIPEDMALPLPARDVEWIVLRGDHPVRDWAGNYPDEEDIEAAFDCAEKVVTWAEERLAVRS